MSARTVPTAGVLRVVVVAGVLHLLGRVTVGGWLALGSAAVLALPLVALVLRPRLDDLAAVRHVSGRPAVGEAVAVTLHVHNHGRRSAPALVAVDELPGFAPVRVAVPPLLPGACAVVAGDRQALERTSTDAGVVRLSALSPVGLVRVQRDLPQPGRSVVHPAVVPAPRLRAATAARGTGGGSVPLPGTGSELLGLRDWRPGESARAVSGRASARHGRPLVLEREREAGPALVVLLVPGGRRTPERERAVSQGCALAVDALRAGRALVLIGGTGTSVPQVLDAFAAADDAPALQAGDLARASAAAGPGGTVVVVAAEGAPPPRVPGCAVVVLDGRTAR